MSENSPAATPATPETPVTPTPATTTPAVTPAPTGTDTTKTTSSDTTTPSLLNEPTKPEPTGAPEKYESFAVPDGYEIAPEVFTEASKVFKDLGLSQTQAQALIDFQAKHSIESANSAVEFAQKTRTDWQNQVKADPEIGGKLDQVKTTISRALDGLGDPKLAADFREAMDYTGAGDNPAFIKAFYRMAQKITEGNVVRGGGPAPSGRTTGQRPGLAQAIYGPSGPRTSPVGPIES